VTLATLPPLAAAKRRVGEQLGSSATTSESRQTMLCAYLSAALLVGLLANATLGWWWADPLVAL
jgi:divalent metal cation (Fe/Co/Zn/Cd) transporter